MNKNLDRKVTESIRGATKNETIEATWMATRWETYEAIGEFLIEL